MLHPDVCRVPKNLVRNRSGRNYLFYCLEQLVLNELLLVERTTHDKILVNGRQPPRTSPPGLSHLR